MSAQAVSERSAGTYSDDGKRMNQKSFVFAIGIVLAGSWIFSPLVTTTNAQIRRAVKMEAVKDKSDTKDAVGQKRPLRQPSPDAKPLPFKKKGPLEQIDQQIAKMVDLKMSRRKLVADFKNNYQQMQRVVNEVRSKLGYGGSSSSSGGTVFNFKFGTQKLNGRVQSTIKDNVTTLHIRLDETIDDQRTLLVNASQDGRFTITINGGSIPYLLRIKQFATGGIIVQEIDGSDVYSCAAPNFETLLQVHSDFCNDRLMPLLSRFGFGSFMTPYDREVQNQVLIALSKMTEAEKKKFRELAGKLDDQLFETRTTASQQLDTKFKDNLDLFLKALNEREFSPETRFRIQKVIQAKEKSDVLSTMKYVNRTGLTQNTDYLFWLLQKQTTPENYDRVFKTITEQTGLKQSDDPAAVQAWMAGHQVAFDTLAMIGRQTQMESSDPLSEKGSIDKGREQIKNFIRLTIKDGNLAIDRDHFAKLFGGKTISQLSAEVEALRAKNNLPKDWYRAGGNHSMSSSGYPQVHFSLISEKFSARTQNAYYHSGIDGRRRSSNRDRTSENNDVRLRLIDNPSQPKSNKRPRFQFAIEEIKTPHRKLVITEHGTGKVDIKFVSEKSDVVMQLLSDENGVYVHDLRGNQVFAAKSASLQKLSDAHPGYFADKFFPVLEYLGLEIDPVLKGRTAGTRPPSFWDLDGK